jgi:hypothetical protein
MTRDVEVRGRILPLVSQQITDFWVAYVPLLDLSGNGETEEEATRKCLQRVESELALQDRWDSQ